jgi:hypothetical protein
MTRSEICSKAGSICSAAKTAAARENGKRGGRPANPEIQRIMVERGCTRQRAHQILRSG